MRRLRIPSMGIVSAMEAIAAIAVVLAIWRLTFPCRHRHPVTVSVLLLLVTTLSTFIIATCLRNSGTHLPPRWTRWRRVLGVANVLIALWFTSVEWIWFREVCPAWHRHQYVFEAHVCSVVVQHRLGRELPTVIQRVAADLGVPCSHERAVQVVHQRWCGFCVCVQPGGTWFHAPDVYPPCAREEVRAMLARDPGFAVTFRQRVLDLGDRDYWTGILTRLYAACPPEELPEYLRLPPGQSSAVPKS
jgi:hypothetical protein